MGQNDAGNRSGIRATYYDRSLATHIDGTSVFANETDRANEQRVADVIASAWSCDVRPFGALSPVDWYASRAGRLSGLLELKCRTHAVEKYPTVFLNVRKWLALTLGSVGMGVPAVFVVRFTDGLRWVPVAEINASNQVVGGCARRVKSDNDIEPVIEVPVSILRPLMPQVRQDSESPRIDLDLGEKNRA